MHEQLVEGHELLEKYDLETRSNLRVQELYYLSSNEMLLAGVLQIPLTKDKQLDCAIFE